MKTSSHPPVYAQIAYDIAHKIATGEIKENERFSGRSLMSSRYAVSPETVRRALKILSDVGIIASQHHTGSVALSQQRAAEYVEKHYLSLDLRQLKRELDRLVDEQNNLLAQTVETINKIVDLSDRFRHNDILRTYEVTLTECSSVIGRTIGELQFRQKTGATIVAVRRDKEVLLSPPAQFRLAAADVLVIACDITGVDKVASFVEQH